MLLSKKPVPQTNHRGFFKAKIADSEQTSRSFGLRDKAGYLLDDAGCNFSFTPISSYMTDTANRHHAEHYAFIILFAKIWYTVNDPIIGGASQAVTRMDVFRWQYENLVKLLEKVDSQYA